MKDKTIWIFGSGPSARDFNFDMIYADDIVFGVNGTVEWLPRIDWWFTLDRSQENLERLCNQRKGVLYHAALPSNVILKTNVIRYYRIAEFGRDGIPGTPEPSKRFSSSWWAWRWSATPTLCETKGVIHTGNSMWGALQIAYQKGFKKIIFVGLDGTNEQRVDGGKPNSLLHLPWLFATAMHQLNRANVRVFNANPASRVTCFPTFNFKKEMAV